MRKFYLICFDISSDKIRRRVVKKLLANSVRVQKSVFEGYLTDKEYLQLKQFLDKKIDQETDSLRYYNICRNCLENVTVTGTGSYTFEEDIIVI